MEGRILDKKFESVKADENNKKWDVISKREQELYDANTDIRSCFERDYTRILHSNAYRRLKHKTTRINTDNKIQYQ